MKMQGAYKTQERNWGITGNPESNPTGASGLSRRCAPRSDGPSVTSVREQNFRPFRLTKKLTKGWSGIKLILIYTSRYFFRGSVYDQYRRGCKN